MLYTIKKDRHYSNKKIPKITFSSSLQFQVKFIKGATHPHINNDSYDWNKLYGFSDSWSLHKSNSVRIGWRSKNNKTVELAAYIYNNKKRYILPIIEVVPNKVLQCKIELVKLKYKVTINGITVISSRSVKGLKGLKYILKPYFGGNNKSPHNILIDIS